MKCVRGHILGLLEGWEGRVGEGMIKMLLYVYEINNK